MSRRVHLHDPNRRPPLPRSLRLGQHLLVDRRLVTELVGSSTIGASDTVYEIGAGTGAITEALAARAGRVVAVERDPVLHARLRQRLGRRPNVELRCGDCRRFPPPPGECKVFASIPFNLTAWIVRTLLARRPPPSDAWLVMQREAAEKFAGIHRASLFSTLHGPWFEMRVVRDIPPEAFRPVPSVMAALLHIRRRPVPLVEGRLAARWRRFVRYGYSGWKPNLRVRFGHFFTDVQWRRLSVDLGFRSDATCTELTLDQWLGVFRYATRGVPELKWRTTLGTLGGAGP